MSYHAEAQKRYRLRHAEAVRERDRERCRAIRRAVLALLGGTCVACGIADERVLQVDHIDGGGKRHRLERPAWGPYRDMRNALLAGEGRDRYQLLCRNCHHIKTTLEERA